MSATTTQPTAIKVEIPEWAKPGRTYDVVFNDDLGCFELAPF